MPGHIHGRAFAVTLNLEEIEALIGEIDALDPLDISQGLHHALIASVSRQRFLQILGAQAHLAEDGMHTGRLQIPPPGGLYAGSQHHHIPLGDIVTLYFGVQRLLLRGGDQKEHLQLGVHPIGMRRHPILEACPEIAGLSARSRDLLHQKGEEMLVAVAHGAGVGPALLRGDDGFLVAEVLHAFPEPIHPRGNRVNVLIEPQVEQIEIISAVFQNIVKERRLAGDASLQVPIVTDADDSGIR